MKKFFLSVFALLSLFSFLGCSIDENSIADDEYYAYYESYSCSQDVYNIALSEFGNKNFSFSDLKDVKNLLARQSTRLNYIYTYDGVVYAGKSECKREEFDSFVRKIGGQAYVEQFKYSGNIIIFLTSDRPDTVTWIYCEKL
ncbi:MAG: hypothetical protein MJZ50_03805 [Treponema sp.]|nr:hypothetical protein [Treponema sp.]